jgi:hypothetical protein
METQNQSKVTEKRMCDRTEKELRKAWIFPDTGDRYFRGIKWTAAFLLGIALSRSLEENIREADTATRQSDALNELKRRGLK